MQPSRNENFPRTPSLKTLERPYMLSRNAKTSSPHIHTIEKIRDSAFSPVLSSDPSKHYMPAKYSESPVNEFQIGGGNSYNKFDINFSLNPASIKGNPVSASEFFIPNAKVKWKPAKSPSAVLPKLISKAFEVDIRSKKIQNRYATNNPYDIKSNTIDHLSIQQDGRKSVEGNLKRMSSHKILKEINSDDDSSSHSFHVDENKKEENLIKKISALRIQLGTMRWKNHTLEKENTELKSLVQSLKDIISKGNLSDPETSVRERSKGYESDEYSTARNTKTANNTMATMTNNAQPSKMWDIAFHERLTNIFKNFSKYKSMFYTLESSVTEACKVFDCGYARILLTNERAKKIYHESGSDKMKKEKIMIGYVQADIIEKKEENVFDYETFNIIENIEEIKKPFNNDGKGVSFPIFSILNPYEFWGAIQIIEPMHTTKHSRIKRRKGFITKDEVLLESYAKIVSLLIDAHDRESMIKQQERKTIRYNDAMAHLVSTKTHQELLEATKLRLADYFDFESIGLLFYEPKEELLFTYNVQKKHDGKFYTLEPLKYSTNVGVSGYCLSQNIDLMAMNEPRKNKNFQPEIDNTTGARVVRNAIIAVLKDEKGKKSGILQLVNKKNYQDIDSRDEMVVRDLQRLLGIVVAHITEVYTTVNLSIAMKKTMKNIEENFQTTDHAS